MKYMKQINANERKKQTKLIIILASVLLLLIISAIVAKVVVDNIENDPPRPEPPEILTGEALLNGYYPIAYPQIQSDDMTYINIKTPEGEYGLVRDTANGELYIMHVPEGGDKLQVYLPPIVDEEGSFNYSSLFAKAPGDSYGITNVYYLCSVIGTLYFDERIPVPTDETEKEELYRYYGFTQDNAKLISFTYKDSEGKEVAHTITIGDKMITDSGYYYMVDNRPYIYVTTSSYLDYALGGAASLINSMLVSEGLKTDSYLGPYITPEYKQWVTTLNKNAGATVESGSNVIVEAEILSPQNPEMSAKPESFIPGGYLGAGFGKTEFDLSEYTGAKYADMIAALLGSAVGSYDGNEIVFTILGSNLSANIPDGEDSVVYTYRVTKIEAILDDGEVSAAGTPVADKKLLKVTYTATAGGTLITPTEYHAVIDLENALIPNSAKEAFAAASVGELSSAIEFSVTYSKDDADNQILHQLIITEIIEIYDGNKSVDIVGEDSIVAYSYVIKSGSKVSEPYTGYIDLSDDEAGEYTETLRELLVGKTVSSDLSLVVETYVEYPEVMADFDTVRIKEIIGFVTKKLVVSFGFIKDNSDKDPFYGESVYENKLGTGNGNYGLNNTVCQTVLSILGGIGGNTTSTDGFVGVQTVAVGLNTETMLKYGLYGKDTHKIHFVLPRNISEIGKTDEEIIYDWTSTLSFTLYISAENEDGTRYVASDMYDIVAKVKSSELVFLNYDFLDMWARRNVMLLDVENITSLKLNLNMPKVYGDYTFDLSHTDYYYDVNGNAYTKPGEGRVHDTFIEIMLTEGEGSMETALSKYIRDNAINGAVDFSKFYGGGKDEWIDYDTSDVYNFKEVLHILYMTSFVGRLTEEEQAAAKELDPIITIELMLKGENKPYRYEFRRFEDRRVMVTISKYNEYTGEFVESSDFYISASVARKIATGFVYLFNGMEVDNEKSYEELPGIAE